MKFLLRHWYNISAFIGIAVIIGTIFFWKDLDYLQGLSLLNFSVINFHFFEEFGFPGGFPAFSNTLFNPKDSTAPERYPLNQLSVLIINWSTAIVMYLIPVFFPNQICLGLTPILFGGVMQVLVHGIVNNVMLKRFYNSGLAAALFGHLPIAIFYINHIVTNNLVTGWDWAIAVGLMFFWYLVVIRTIIPKFFENPNSPYPFADEEMKRFKPVKS